MSALAIEQLFVSKSLQGTSYSTENREIAAERSSTSPTIPVAYEVEIYV